MIYPFPDDALHGHPSCFSQSQYTVMAIVGILIIGGHFGDLVAPQGYAYHQLIKDIKIGQ